MDELIESLLALLRPPSPAGPRIDAFALVQAIVDDLPAAGPGLGAEQLARAGTPFLRWSDADGDDGRRAGLGLGLYIARALAEREGGDLRLAARDGGGLLATVELPLAD